jgi:hypothetical protein
MVLTWKSINTLIFISLEIFAKRFKHVSTRCKREKIKLIAVFAPLLPPPPPQLSRSQFIPYFVFSSSLFPLCCVQSLCVQCMQQLSGKGEKDPIRRRQQKSVHLPIYSIEEYTNICRVDVFSIRWLVTD